MALKFISQESEPSYIALSTDIADDKITGAVAIGKKVYLTDTSVWKIIKPDLTLGDYAIPASFSGDITLGTVSIDQTTPGDTNGVAVGESAAGSDGLGNHIAVITAPGSVGSAPLATFPYVFNGTTWDRLRGSSASGMKVSSPVLSVASAITGQVTVTTAGTEVQISASSVPLNNGVFVKALPANTGIMYVGNNGSNAISSSTGYPLDAGEQVFFQVADLDEIWVDASVSGEKVAWAKG